MRTTPPLAVFLVCTVALPPAAGADEPPPAPWEVSREERDAQTARSRHPDWNVYEENVRAYTLPDLFRLADGGRVRSPEDWERRRRPELLEIFRWEMFGVAPPAPRPIGSAPPWGQASRLPDGPDGFSSREIESAPALEGRATKRRVALEFVMGGERFGFPITIVVPTRRSAPAPVFLLLNHRGSEVAAAEAALDPEYWPLERGIELGFAMAVLHTSAEVEPDARHATTGVRAFFRRHHDAPETLTWGALGAWAWAASRAMDHFATDPDLDPARVAVVGHSRSGKAALWAAAQDTRFALVCCNNAGEGGPALARRDFGETLGHITRNFPHWFTPAYAAYADRIDDLPMDQHELIALVAPRGYHGADGALDLHADPRGSWLGLVEASRAWALFGAARPLPDRMPRVGEVLTDGPLAHHLRAGGHALTGSDWERFFAHASGLFAAKGGRSSTQTPSEDSGPPGRLTLGVSAPRSRPRDAAPRSHAPDESPRLRRSQG